MRSVSAMARSSPKFGSVTITPSMVVAVLLKQVRAARCFGARLHRAELGLFWPDGYHAVARFLEHRDHFRASALRQMVREEPPIAHNHTKGDCAGCTVRHSL